MYAECHGSVDVRTTSPTAEKQPDVDVSTLHFYGFVLAVDSFFLRLESSQTRRWADLAVWKSIHTHHW